MRAVLGCKEGVDGQRKNRTPVCCESAWRLLASASDASSRRVRRCRSPFLFSLSYPCTAISLLASFRSFLSPWILSFSADFISLLPVAYKECVLFFASFRLVFLHLPPPPSCSMGLFCTTFNVSLPSLSFLPLRLCRSASVYQLYFSLYISVLLAVFESRTVFASGLRVSEPDAWTSQSRRTRFMSFFRAAAAPSAAVRLGGTSEKITFCGTG